MRFLTPWRFIGGLLQVAIDGALEASISAVDNVAESLSKDYRNDPVYKQKLQELIERNKQFEDERNDRRP